MTRKLACSFDNPEKEYQAEIIIEPSLILKVFPEHENKRFIGRIWHCMKSKGNIEIYSTKYKH